MGEPKKVNFQKLKDVLIEQKIALGKINGALKKMEKAMHDFNSLCLRVYTS